MLYAMLFLLSFISCFCNELIDFRDQSIARIEEDKAYLNHERLFCKNHIFFLLNDNAIMSPIYDVRYNSQGFYISLEEEPTCFNGHPGIVRVREKGKFVWYCMIDGCPYFIGERF